MRIGAGHELSAQDVADHARPAGARTTPRPHQGFVNRLLVGGQVEYFATGHVVNE
jgi:hypothetical protein